LDILIFISYDQNYINNYLSGINLSLLLWPGKMDQVKKEKPLNSGFAQAKLFFAASVFPAGAFT
jgi:hypothetical protein